MAERLILKGNFLRFKSNHRLYFEPLADANISQQNIADWREKKIHNIYFFGRKDSLKKIKKGSRAAKKEGFTISVLSLDVIEKKELYYYSQINQNIKKGLESDSSLFLYNREDKAVILALISILVMSLNPPQGLSDPQGAIRYVCDRKELIPEDVLVFEFKEATDLTYQMPDTISDFFYKPEATPVKLKKVITAEVEKEPAPEEKTPEEKEPEAAQDKNIEDEKATDLEPVGKVESQIKNRRKGSRFFTIRNKMLIVILSTIIIALGIMIFLASFFYRADSETRITDHSLTTTDLIGQTIESEFKKLSFLALNTASTILQTSGSSENKDLLIELFFQNNKEFILLGVAERGDAGFTVNEMIYNDKFSRDFTKVKLMELIRRDESIFLKAFQGTPVVHNASPGLSSPIMGIALPLGIENPDIIVIAFIEPGIFLRAFKTTGIIKTFMVDGEGAILAHSDSKLVLAGENMSNLPIVRHMMESKTDNGKIEFQNEEGVSFIGIFKKLNYANLGIISVVKEKTAFQTVNDMQRRNLLIMTIILISSILIIFFFARTLSVPIVRLLRATKEVEAGNYGIQIEPTTSDEIGSLTRSFSSMAHGLAEREKMKDAFGKFVNKEIAERVLKGDIKLGGEEKECAIFFSDLRGFTAMSEKMTPEGVVEYLNEYFTGMVKCINDTHGIVDKYIGDAIMAHWGAIVSHGNDTENAINTAICMRHALIEFNQRGSGKRPFARFGCGINTGAVISGQIGSAERLEYTIIGDAVNLASRIETLNKPFGTDILISQDSLDQVKGSFNVEAMPAIKVKGKTEPQKIYAVLGRKNDPECPANLDEVRKLTGTEKPEVDLDKFDDKKEDKFEVIPG